MTQTTRDSLRRSVLSAVEYGELALSDEALAMRTALIQEGLVREVVSYELTSLGTKELEGGN